METFQKYSKTDVICLKKVPNPSKNFVSPTRIPVSHKLLLFILLSKYRSLFLSLAVTCLHFPAITCPQFPMHCEKYFLPRALYSLSLEYEIFSLAGRKNLAPCTIRSDLGDVRISKKIFQESRNYLGQNCQFLSSMNYARKKEGKTVF